jgi:hypothetical protein
MNSEQKAQALAQFTDYFVKNYPGPDTIIYNPNWHAPKIFAAAHSAITAALNHSEDAALQAEAMKREMAELREALRPFAKFAEKAERFVQGRADFGGEPVMPTKHFHLSDFRRARTLIQGEKP